MIVAICGPTGVGKTKLSVALAKKINAIIVNCDAVQVYKELNIGSAKPTEVEKEGIKHLLFDIKSVTENYTVKDYQKDLRNILEEYKYKNIIIVGGTGLYLCAGLYNYEFNNETQLKDYSIYSNKQLYQMALNKNPNMDIHQNNRIRLIRYLSREELSKKGQELLYDVKFIGLTTKREQLYKIIDKRVDNMIKNGLIEEVKNLQNYFNESRVLNTAIGYKEIIEYLNQKISKDEAIELIKKNSRHYAKRQYTWFNNKMNITWFNTNFDNFSETISKVEDFLKNK